MTAPIVHGYPDYGRFQARSDVMFLDVEDQLLTGSTDYGAFFTGGHQYVALSVCTLTKKMQYTLFWGTDEPMTTTIAADSMLVQAASCNALVFPVLGPWLLLRADAQSFNATHTARLFSVPSPASITNQDATGTIIYQTEITPVNAATTLSLTSSKVFAGEAFLFSYCAATSGYIQLSTANLNAASEKFLLTSDRAAGEAALQRYTVILPALPIEVDFVNNDGVARDFMLTLIGRPLHGGR